MLTVKIIAPSAKKLYCRRFSSIPKTPSLWTPGNIVKSPFRDVAIPNITIPEKIWQNLDKWADKTALVCGITNRSYTYHQLYKYSRNFATRLISQFGIRNGDLVCIMMPNCPEFGIASLGILQAGAAVTTINPVFTAHEVKRQVITSNPKVIIGVPESINVIREALKDDNLNIPLIAVKDSEKGLPQGTVPFEELALGNNIDHSVLNGITTKSEDLSILAFSSGTTGLPKGVEINHQSVILTFDQLDTDEVKHHSDTTSSTQDSVLGILPFYHVYGYIIVLLHKLSAGLKIVTLPKFQPETFLSAMKDYKINLLLAAPPLILFCGTHEKFTKDFLAHTKIITSAAAPLAAHDITRMLEKSPTEMKFMQLYGLTETLLATSMIPGDTHYTSAGFPLPNVELKIVDTDMNSLGPNQLGEVLIRGPQIFKRYLNNEEATRAAFTDGGWMRSGDLGVIDEEGRLTIADRLKELIKVKGFQVPPAELENVLKEYPAIQDAAVIGIPDEKYGEVPKAFIVVKEGHKLKTDDVIKFVEERVAPYKKIKEVVIHNSIPKNPSGKILRRVLREEYS